MKVQSLKVSNYKRFVEPSELGFHDELTLLLGSNGSGKTSIMQMIAAMVGTATKELKSPSELNWAGFNYDLINSNRSLLDAQVQVVFSDIELSSIQTLYDALPNNNKQIKPSNERNVTLNFNYHHNTIDTVTEAQKKQFGGYTYAKMNAKFNQNKSNFDNIGNIYWYSEERNAKSFKLDESSKKPNESDIRSFLSNSYLFHTNIQTGRLPLKDDQRDIFADLENNFKKVFPERSFVGPVPRNGGDALQSAWFMLSDGTNQYEISEMSAGERAIFPILFDFANWKINNSIILIDELELHLHPPLQQAFLRALPLLGHNNQFIISTHSDYIASLVDESQIIRL
jgi:predicted ATP-dependent endonuclease of OLD family